MPALWDVVSDDLSGESCAMHYKAGRILALVRVDLNIDGPNTDGAVLAVGARLKGWHESISLRLGPVSAGRSATHAAVGYALEEAQRALMLGERLRGPGHLTVYSDVFVLDYADRLIQDDLLAGVYEPLMSRLVAFDQAEGTDLIPTLEHYLAGGGSMRRVATVMGIHRNTVLYRLKRIEEVAGVDLDDGEVRFFIQLALRAYRYLAA
jgi:DNA-binding PucR family transcriptional regulator